jgi:hypothetical protein
MINFWRKEYYMSNNNPADHLANRLKVELAKNEIENDQARFIEVKDGKDTYRVRAGRNGAPWEKFDPETGEKTIISTRTLTNELQESLDNGAKVISKDGPDFGPGRKPDKKY